MAIEAPKPIEIPEIANSELTGQVLEKVKLALWENTEARDELARDRLDPKSLRRFKINSVSYRFWLRHQEFGTNTLIESLMLGSEEMNESILNSTSKYQLNADGSKTFFGAGRLSLSVNGVKYYKQDALDNLESAFPQIFSSRA